jgi:hypothetical protein
LNAKQEERAQGLNSIEEIVAKKPLKLMPDTKAQVEETERISIKIKIYLDSSDTNY